MVDLDELKMPVAFRYRFPQDSWDFAQVDSGIGKGHFNTPEVEPLFSADTFNALEAEVARLTELADKYKWQVRDTCARAEAAETSLAAVKAENERLRAELIKARAVIFGEYGNCHSVARIDAALETTDG